MNNQKSFTELVELHERKWGEMQYVNRPTLQQLLNCPIIAMWRAENKFMFSAHYNADDLNDTILTMLTDISRPFWKLYKVFYHQQPIEFTVKVVSPNKKTKPTNTPNTLPVRDAKVLPGRKVNILRTHFNGKGNKK